MIVRRPVQTDIRLQKGTNNIALREPACLLASEILHQLPQRMP